MEVIRVSYSSLGTFSTCPRKFELNKLYPRIKQDPRENYAADVGKAIHAGYQHFLITGDSEASVWRFMEAFPYETEFLQPNDYRSFNAALATLEEMFIHLRMNDYRLAQIKKPDGTIGPAIEVPFAIRFNGLEVAPCARYPEGARFEFTGYIDAIMQNILNSMFRSLDIKSSRMKLADASAKFKYDTQQVPYGIVIEHVAGQLVEKFEVLYLDCYVDLLEPEVKLYPFMKSQSDIQEWGMNKVIQFQQLARFIGADYFPRTENGCVFYNKGCKYLDVCQSRDRQAIIDFMTLGMELATEEEFVPWIVADLNVGS